MLNPILDPIFPYIHIYYFLRSAMNVELYVKDSRSRGTGQAETSHLVSISDKDERLVVIDEILILVCLPTGEIACKNFKWPQDVVCGMNIYRFVSYPSCQWRCKGIYYSTYKKYQTDLSSIQIHHLAEKWKEKLVFRPNE